TSIYLPCNGSSCFLSSATISSVAASLDSGLPLSRPKCAWISLYHLSAPGNWAQVRVIRAFVFHVIVASGSSSVVPIDGGRVGIPLVTGQPRRQVLGHARKQLLQHGSHTCRKSLKTCILS